MIKLTEPKFYENKDKSHCVQACLKMVFSELLPDVGFSWEELEKLTNYLPGHGAWVYPELLGIQNLGLETQFVTGFNCQKFIKFGFDYIEEEYGKEVADYERTHPHDYERIKRQIQEALDKNLISQRIAGMEDVKQLIDEGWYVMLLVNSKALNGKEGYAGHRVLVYGYDNKGVIMHDPGPTSSQGEARYVDWEVVERAWAYPNDRAKEMIAVRKKKEDG